MSYPIYPKHEYNCPKVGECPHLGGASVIHVAQIANRSENTRDSSLREIRVLEEQNRELLSEVVSLQEQLERTKLELKLERQNKFAVGCDSDEESQEEEAPEETGEEKVPGKRGAPLGHPGWFRKTPQEYDWEVGVSAPRRCPCCASLNVKVLDADPQEHLQEDIIDGQFRVVLYRHVTARCDDCDTLVQKAGPGEALGSRIGPGLRSKAIYLRNVIGITYRKVPRTIEELFGIRFTAAALIGFEKAIAKLAEPVVDDIAKKLASTDGPVHADETYWTLDGERAFFWVHGNERFIHFTFETTRAGFVSRDVLGPDFCGTLVTDCYGGYNAQVAGAKQKCLAHLARTARDWQKLVASGSIDDQFFDDVREFVKRGTRLHRRRKAGKLKGKALEAEIKWLRLELERLSLTDVEDEKSIQLQGRILRHLPEWLVFVDDPCVPPTNNLAERAIRPLVVLRKLTFGSRSLEGGQRMADLMTVAETARRHGHRASDIYYGLFTRPPDHVLRTLYASA
ncbi:IS66 family transposase [Rhodopirellula sp. SWK7]|uniref:IS66 family transposase n=1 Tax=Rhodopirellula sp. SWK7 TaxID=595460 RepID=UPI0002BF2731|nr:IS66 family transposase [Rhodopirellula sp. SWK7]EMI42198.1 Transposase IS66 [Rhodopirellula sp. SWK7]